MNDGSAKQQIVEGIRANSNILVTVSDSPNVDELSAALGLTMLLNKLDKRATAIFSGSVPPAITFLDPSRTFESTVDSLRDFIIALDKEKADHLRYKVDGDVVKIFITPYRTTLSDKDLAFSQGDYNVEMVIALGVRDQDHLDKALGAHGRILHDALVTTISIGDMNSALGSVDWRDAMASSYCEVLVGLSEALKEETPVLDQQIATAFLTGIVSATDRFSNDRTSSRVMTMAAQLMAAGADQQLIATKLQEQHAIKPAPAATVSEPAPKANKDEAMIDLSKERSGSSRRDKRKKDKPAQSDKPADSGPVAVPEQPAESVLDAPAPEQPPVTELVNTTEAPVADTSADQRKPLKTIEPLSDIASIMPEPIMSQAQEESALAEAASVDAAMDRAGTHDSIEQAFSNAMAVSEPNPPGALEQELSAALAAEQSTVPASDSAMPGFEPIGEPVQAPAPSIVSDHAGGGYIASDAASTFDTPVNAMPGASAEPSTIDPFSAPLPPLPDAAPTTPAPEQPAPLVDTPTSTMPPLPPADQQLPVADMPPLPDYSTLPPLPSPDIPPLFDQPPLPGAPAADPAPPVDKLGDVFPDPTPADIAAAAPPPPGQFKIPGQ